MNVYSKLSHKFEGADVAAGLQLTGQLGGHDLTEFHDALYKSEDSIISGSRTFEKVKGTKPFTSTGAVNGLDLATNLAYLDETKTLEGKYSFAEIDAKNLQVNAVGEDVSGVIDGVNFDAVDGKLFHLDREQTVSATYTFASPSTSVTFKGAVVGDGNPDNGLGTINGQDVANMNVADRTWEAVAAVKVAAQAEANVFCRHVKTLHKAYINNVEDSFYSLAQESETLSATDFKMFKSINTGAKTVLVGIDSTKIYFLLKILNNDNQPDFSKIEDLELLTANSEPVTNARSFEVISIHKEDSMAFYALIVCDEGLVIVEVDCTLTDSSSTSSVDATQVGNPIPGMVGVTYVPSSGRILLVQEVSVSGGYQTKVSSHPIPHAFTEASTRAMDFRNCILAGDTCSLLSKVDLIWQGNQAADKVVNSKMDVLISGDRVYIAITKNANTATVIDVGFSWSAQAHISYNVSSSVTNVYVEMNEFTLFINEGKVYLASASRKEVNISPVGLIFSNITFYFS